MKTAPPLLALAAGRKPRVLSRKVQAERPKEIVLQMSTAKILREFARADWQWTHFPAGELRDKRTAGKLKQMGMRSGWPDFVMIPPTGQLHCLELKREGERLSDDQSAFQDWCIRHGVPYVIAFKIDHVLAAFAAWGCLTHRIGGAK